MKQLGTAISESLTDSEPISVAISNIKEAGYDVFLVLEATIGFNKQQGKPPEKDFLPQARNGKLSLTTEDAQFLKSLRISVVGDDSQSEKTSI
ncbi:MAG: hypothetical protein HY313_10225 [Acidobacteria bacterium]|nr:hypothetical protein [Acidobacteriota bacterium]